MQEKNSRDELLHTIEKTAHDYEKSFHGCSDAPAAAGNQWGFVFESHVDASLREMQKPVSLGPG